MQRASWDQFFALERSTENLWAQMACVFVVCCHCTNPARSPLHPLLRQSAALSALTFDCHSRSSTILDLEMSEHFMWRDIWQSKVTSWWFVIKRERSSSKLIYRYLMILDFIDGRRVLSTLLWTVKMWESFNKIQISWGFLSHFWGHLSYFRQFVSDFSTNIEQ